MSDPRVEERRMCDQARDLLRRLAANDERLLGDVLVPASSGRSIWQGVPAPGLTRRTRGLVRLSALLAIDAPTASLRWAVELACTDGVDDDAVVGTFLSTAATTGSAQVVSTAPRLR